ncbi:MAG: hypothetical protein F6K21_06490 [Symploca sp. SIO2D2]|nr:hypothetical protein [Symploca sp. SIO2D2]
MATKLSDFFRLADKHSEEDERFYNLIEDKQNSVECHKALVTVFADALKLNSYRYRNEKVPYSTTQIPDEKTLDALLIYLSSVLKDPLAQVLFEQISSKAGLVKDWGNNCVLYPTSTDESKASLQASVDAVRGVEYAILYNQLRDTYIDVDWPDKEAKENLPDPIDNPKVESPPLVSDVKKKKINKLKEWIKKYDPKIIFLEKQLVTTATTTAKKATTKTIVSAIYGDESTSLPIAVNLLSQVLLNQVYSKSGTSKVGNAGGKNAFFRTVHEQVKNSESIWKNDKFKEIVDQITPLNVNKGITNSVPKLFQLTKQLFQTGLGLSDSTLKQKVSQAIGAIVTAVQNQQTDQQSYMLDRLQGMCQAVLKSYTENCNTLETWAVEIDAGIPEYISKQHIGYLMEAACSVLSSIPLQPQANFAADKIKDIRLFAFSNFGVISQAKDSYGRPYVKYSNDDPLTTDKVIVEPDAAEDTGTGTGLVNYYRPTYSVITDNDDNAALKFFNVGTTPGDGDFYIIDAGKPTRVLTKQLKPVMPLEFDFTSKTINGLTNVPAPGVAGFSAGIPFKTTDASGSSSRVFYDIIKAVSKWTQLSGRRTYDVLYQTVGGSPTPNTHLIWRLPAGGGLSRAESVDESLVLWEWLRPSGSSFLRLGEFLDLPPKRQIVRMPSLGKVINVGEVAYEIVQEVDRVINGITYHFLEIRSSPTAASETYVLTNTPHPNLPEAIDSALDRGIESTQIGVKSARILQVLNFSYYRKVHTTDAANPKVIKWIPKTGSPQRPVVGGGITIDETSEDDTVIGIDLPISFRLQQNIAKFKELTGVNGQMHPSIKNKESNLYRSTGARKDAGTVMKELNKFLINPPTTKSTLPATVFGNWAVAKSQEVLNSWQRLKDTNRSLLPTNQEWCHIKGHGDSGDERLGNFVGGSFHCNTEQLAIESGQRITTQSLPKETFKLYSTAYLFKNEDGVMVEVEGSKNYLQSGDKAYQEIVEVHNKLKKQNKRPPSKDTGAGTNIPFAAFFRYKVERKPDSDKYKREKVFEHIFEGQSEFMDVHQFSILSKTTEFVVAGMEAFQQWYTNQEDAPQVGVKRKRDDPHADNKEEGGDTE